MTNNINTPTLLFTAYGDTVEVEPTFGRYNNDRLAISFVCDNGPYGHLTVNLPNDYLNDGEVFIKDWSENEPLVEALLEFGWIEYMHREVQAGFAIAKVAKPAGPLLDYMKALGLCPVEDDFRFEEAETEWWLSDDPIDPGPPSH